MTAPNSNIRFFPLDDITLSNINPRQADDHDSDEVAALAMSIAVAGLIQPLACFLPNPDAPETVDGGRRLAALQHLRRSGSELAEAREPDWDAIPCVTTDDPATARAWAGAAATSYVPLTATQEIRAYAAMRAQGTEPEMIAHAFGVELRHVKRRLALASLTTETLDALASGDITLDVARTLTIAPSPEREIAVLRAAIEKQMGAFSVRHALEETVVMGDDRRAVFVGVDAYQDAGGTVTEDLFRDQAVLHDPDLLAKLFADKISAHAESIKGAWLWAKPVIDNPYPSAGDVAGHDNIARTPGELPEADASEYDRLTEALRTDTIDDAGKAQLAALQARLDGDWDETTYATSGIFVYVDRDGLPQISGAWRDKAQEPARDRDQGSDADTAEKLTPKPTPQNARDDFARIVTAATQTALLNRHDYLLWLLAYQLEAGLQAWNSPLQVTFNPPAITPERDSNLHLNARLTDGPQLDRGPDLAGFQAFMDQSTKHRNAVLTRHLARAFGPQDLSAFQSKLAGTLEIDIRKIWTPDAANCFKRLPAERLDDIWAALVPAEKAEALDPAFATLNKGKKAAELEKLFCNDGYREALGLSRDEAAAIDAWLPAEMT
ncbi:MAG: ParB/RepB/Spo0J family partition protein [Pseudomonadota bacterium]